MATHDVQQAASTFSVVVGRHPEMARVVDTTARLDRVYSGALWCEGPAWSSARATLVFSDVRKNAILALDGLGDAQALREPSNFANGNAFDSQGRLVTCEHLGRRLVRREADGRITVLADTHDGQPLNSPNDLAVAPDGAIWFTDPTFGLVTPQEGRMRESKQRGRFVFRLDPSGRLDVASDSFEQPNGIVFSPDHKTLYVSDASGTDGKEGKREIRAFDVEGGRRLVRERLFAMVDSGVPDGLDVDEAGRLYAGCAEGVRIWRADGEALGLIATPSTCGNLAFGGPDRKRLYACTGETIHAITLKAAGAHRLG
ncbi:MAG: gluconolactonase [Rhizobacter sp.]|nr:gluconolactonase [Rhizobacter sp.]